MQRLILRLDGNACISTDVFNDDWPKALNELLNIMERWHPTRKIVKVEKANYNAAYRDKFWYETVEVDLATWVYEPRLGPEPRPVLPTRVFPKLSSKPSVPLPIPVTPKARRALKRAVPVAVEPEAGSIEDRLESLLERVQAHRALT